jgi:SnoaL-like domain
VALSPEDRFAIQDLYARYCHTIDANEGEAWADCFTEEGSFVPSIGPIAGEPYIGRQALAALGGDTNREPPTRHWNNNLLLEEHDGYVVGTCYAVAIEVHGQAPDVVAHVVYHDELVKANGAWRFRSRRPRADIEKPGSGAQ